MLVVTNPAEVYSSKTRKYKLALTSVLVLEHRGSKEFTSVMLLDCGSKEPTVDC